MNYKRIGVILALVLLLTVFMSAYIKHKTERLFEQSIVALDGGVLKYHEVNVRLFKQFPQLYLEVSGLAIEQANTVNYEIDTLMGTLALAKVFHDELHISTLRLIRPQFYIAQSEKQDSPKDTSLVLTHDSNSGTDKVLAFPFHLVFDALSIKNGTVHYPFADRAYWQVNALNCFIQGDLKQGLSLAELSTDLSATFNYKTEELALKDIPFGLQANVALLDGKLRIEQGAFELAHIVHQLQGEILLDSQPQFDINFRSEQASLKSLLALMPVAGLQDSNLLVRGSITSDGVIKGKYQGPDAWPLMQLQLESSDASLAYQQQSAGIDKIYVRALIAHPEGTSLDATSLELDSLHLQSDANYIKGQVKMHHLVSSPYIKAALDGDVDLKDMRDVFPFKSQVLKGRVKADINMAGYLSDIAEENYQAFMADGQVVLRRFYVKNHRFPQGLDINNAAFDFSPESIRLRSFTGHLGKSELIMQGSFYNYISYIFDDEDLKGELAVQSTFLNLNEFKAAEGQSSASSNSVQSAHSSTPFMVPAGLNLIFETAIDVVQADEAIFKQCQGKMAIKEERLHLENLSFKSYGGDVLLTGSYDTQNAHKIKSNLHISAVDVQIDEAASSITLLQQSVPLSQMAKGKVSTRMSYYGEMDDKGTLNLNTLKATGEIESRGLHFSDHPSLYQLANQLKDSRYKSFTTSPFTIDFNMEKGQLNIAPFEIKIVEKNIKASGWYRVDNTLNFKVKTTVKAKEIGGDVNRYVAMLSDANKPLPVTVIFTGDASQPNIKYDTREAIDILRKDVTKNLNNDVVKSVIRGFFK